MQRKTKDPKSHRTVSPDEWPGFSFVAVERDADMFFATLAHRDGTPALDTVLPQTFISLQLIEVQPSREEVKSDGTPVRIARVTGDLYYIQANECAKEESTND